MPDNVPDVVQFIGKIVELLAEEAVGEDVLARLLVVSRVVRLVRVMRLVRALAAMRWTIVVFRLMMVMRPIMTVRLVRTTIHGTAVVARAVVVIVRPSSNLDTLVSNNFIHCNNRAGPAILFGVGIDELKDLLVGFPMVVLVAAVMPQRLDMALR